MGIFDEGFGELTLSLIDAFSDTPATFTRRVEASFDPATDTTTAAPSIVEQIKTTPPRGYNAFLIDGTRIQVGDQRVLVGASWGALGAPRIGDRIERGSLVGVIHSIQAISSGDQTIGYKLQIRIP